MKRLEGKIAIVAGVGRGIAITYAREGAKVVVASRTKSTVDSVVEEIRAECGSWGREVRARASSTACDARTRASV